jgi:hypothetical protein
LRFYTLFVSETTGKAILLFAVLFILAFWSFFIAYGTLPAIKLHFRIEILLFFFSFIISAFGAMFFHDQPMLITIYAQYAFYLFLFYFLIHKLRPDSDTIIKMFLWLGYIYAFLYFIQYILYPMEIIMSPSLKDRGTIRIMMPGAEYMVAAWFILLSKFFRTRQLKNLFGLIPFIIVLILLGTRQLMAATALITLINILLSKSLKSKAIVIVAIAVAFVPFYFLFQDIFNNIAALSNKQQANLQGNIRLFAANYFMFEMNHNPVWVLTGNGFPGPHSEYGKFLMRISSQLGYYQSDVGIIGDFSKFGILYVIAELSILFKMVFFRMDEKYSFIRYTAIMMLMTLFTGAGLGPGVILQMCFLAYLIDTNKQPEHNQTES